MLYDIVIVGFGPVGATCANLAGKQGLRTLALDRSTDIYPNPRAMGFDHEIMRVFQNLGLADEMAPHVAPYRPSEYRGTREQVIKRLDSQPAPYPLGWAPNMVFTQPPVEQCLRRLAGFWPNVDVRLGHEVTELRREADRVVVIHRDPDGRSHEVAARYVLACDGGTSPVRGQLGLPMESLDFDEPWLVVDARVDPAHLHTLPDVNVQYCEPDRPATYVVGPGNHRRWEFMLLPDEKAEDMNAEAAIRRLIARWIPPEHVDIWRASTYRFHALVLSTWRSGRVFLLGDAAHMTPPFLAQGMCQGVRDAANLVWKLKAVLDGRADEGLLDSYQIERKPHVQKTTALAKTLGRIICERDPAAAQARDEKLRTEKGEDPPTEIRQHLIPGLTEGFLDRRAEGVSLDLPGMVFPQPRAIGPGGEVHRLDDITGMGFRLVVRDPVATDIILDSHRALLDTLPLTVVQVAAEVPPAQPGVLAVADRDGLLLRWMDTHTCNAVLVRPDHYVFGGAVDTAATQRLLTRLGTAFGPATAPVTEGTSPCR